MAIYKPDIKIYYGDTTADNRLVPAPDITISIEYNYSNDSIIGYTYIFNLNGLATGLDLRNIAYSGSYTEPDNYNLGGVVDHINKLRKILSQNGSVLKIVDGQTESTILEARGGILRSFSFDESNNNWTHFATYSASLEFSNVDFMSSTESCGSVFLDPDSFPSGTAGIVDINSFKVKNFSDSWSFTFNENEAYSRVKIIDTGGNLNLNNLSFNIEYSINATGKHHHVLDEGVSKLVPAWEQAKNFVQYRLHAQVTNLINNVLKNPYTPCTSTDGLSQVNTPGSSGLLSSLNDSNYKIYNEEITCEASESDGTFSASYSAIIKSVIGNSAWSHHAATHNIEKSISTSTNSDGKTSKNISLSGTIQGLIEGGLIRTNKALQLPNTGSIILLNNITDNKYDNAKIVLDKIYSDTDYGGGQGECGKRDLKQTFKSILGINIASLITEDEEEPAEDSSCPENNDQCVIPDPPHPSSFNLTHDYNNGTITYSLDYNSDDNNCSDGGNAKFTQISIQTSNPNKAIATFNAPNSNGCPVIQQLGTYTSKTVNVTISGKDSSCEGKPKEIDFSNLIQCQSCVDELDDLPIPLPATNNAILTQKQYTKNPIDGTYTINLAYICGTNGCNLDGTVGS
jgi:hypothetical protein